jgi:hypothetical protein
MSPSVHIGDTQFSVSACEEQALLGERADRVAERRESPRRYLASMTVKRVFNSESRGRTQESETRKCVRRCVYIT